MERDIGIFEDYMGVQYKEGRQARNNGIGSDCNPYDLQSEMGKAWLDGWKGELNSAK